MIPMFVLGLALAESVTMPGQPTPPPAEPGPTTATTPAPTAAVSSVASPVEQLEPRPTVEISLITGTQWLGRSSFDDEGQRTIVGVGFRYLLNRHLSVDAAFSHTSSVGYLGFSSSADDPYSSYYDDEGYAYENDGSVRTAMSTERLDLGVRGTLPVTRWFHPFAKVAAVGTLNPASLDEDPEDSENINALSTIGVTGGGYAAAGVSFPIRLRHQVSLIPSFELGYSVLAPLKLSDWGEIRQSGATAKLSAGVTF